MARPSLEQGNGGSARGEAEAVSAERRPARLVADEHGLKSSSDQGVMSACVVATPQAPSFAVDCRWFLCDDRLRSRTPVTAGLQLQDSFAGEGGVRTRRVCSFNIHFLGDTMPLYTIRVTRKRAGSETAQ